MSERPVPEGVREPDFEVIRSPEITRRLELLWRPPTPSGKGRKPRFTLDDVVAAGMRVALEGGMEALSMRKVAAELGVGAMSLYTYVPGRAELVDLMIDRAYASMKLPGPGDPWRSALRKYAREHWELYQRHPWIMQTNLWRPPLSPHVLDAQEAGLRCLIDTGLPERRVVEVVGLVDNMVQGVARAAIAESREQDATGTDTDDYWSSVSSFWEDFFDYDRYPVMTRVWNAGAFDSVAGFDSMLERLLDAVGRLIEIPPNKP